MRMPPIDKLLPHLKEVKLPPLPQFNSTAMTEGLKETLAPAGHFLVGLNPWPLLREGSVIIKDVTGEQLLRFIQWQAMVADAFLGLLRALLSMPGRTGLALAQAFSQIGHAVAGFAQAVAGLVAAAAQEVAGLAQAVARAVTQGVTHGCRGVISAPMAAWRGLASAVAAVARAVGAAGGAAGGLVRAIAVGSVRAISGAVTGIVYGIGGAITGSARGVGSAITGAAHAVRGAFAALGCQLRELPYALRLKKKPPPVEPPATVAVPPLLIAAFVFAVVSLILLLWLMRPKKNGLQQHARVAPPSPPKSPVKSASPAKRTSSLQLIPLISKEEKPTTSTALMRGALNPELDFSRTELIDLFEQDVHSAPRIELPPHKGLFTPIGRDDTDPHVRVRVLQWNLNGLLGVRTGAGTIDAHTMLKVLLASNADVMLLQNTINKPNEWYKVHGYTEAAHQMALLDQLLRAEGYVLKRTPTDGQGDNTPALIASRYALLDGGGFPLDGEYRATLLEADGETRSARYVELPLGPAADAPTLGFFVAHLHHRNHHSGNPATGVRANEVDKILRAWRHRPGHFTGRRVGTLFATDFNEVRQSEYSSNEWAFLSKGIVRGADGVHGAKGLLEKAGFVNVSDMPQISRSALHQANGAPRFTCWSGTTTDHAYLHTERRESGAARVRASAVNVLPVLLSNHLPTTIDLVVEL